MKSLMPSPHALRWALASVAVVAAALIGSQWGAYGERSQVAADLSGYQSTLATIEEKHLAEVTQLRTQRDVADASNKALQKSLKQLQDQSLERRSTNRLYERIEGKDVSTGLGIDTITRVDGADGEPTELHITVVQARGRTRVKGQIGVALLGEKDGSNWREVVVEVSSDSAPRFDMRFYQTLVVVLPENNILIDLVEIDVEPDGKRHKSFSYEMDWAEVLED